MEGGNGINPFPPSHRVCSRLGAGGELLQREGIFAADHDGGGGALVTRLEADESLLGLQLLSVVAGGQVDLAPEEAFGAGLQLQVVAAVAVGAVARDDEAAHVAGVVLLVVPIAEALEVSRGVIRIHLLLAARAHVAREEVLRLGVDEPPGLVGVVLENVERVGRPVLAGVGVAVATGAIVAVVSVAVVALAFAGHTARTAVGAAASAAFVAGRRDGRVGTAARVGGDDDGSEESDERVVERLHGV